MKRLLTATTVVVASALLLAGCGGGGSVSTSDPVTPPSTEPTETVETASDLALAVYKAAGDAMKAGTKAAADAKKYAGMLRALHAKGESATATANAQKVFDAQTTLTNAITAAKTAVAEARAALTGASTEDMALLNAAITDSEADIKAAETSLLAVNNHVDGIDGTTASPKTAADQGKAVATEVAGALTRAAALLSDGTTPVMSTAATPAVYRNNSKDGKTWAQIVESIGKTIVSLPLLDGNAEAKVVSIATEAITVGDTVTEISGAIAGTSVTYMGVGGTAWCLGGTATACTISDGKAPAKVYFRPAEDERSTYVRVEGSTNYMAETTAEYGYWLSDNDNDNDPATADVLRVDVFATGTAQTDPALAVDGTNSNTSATYNGSAVGMSVLNSVDGNSKVTNEASGHFDADVRLTAKFGATPTLEGMVNNFRGNAIGSGWNVTLNSTGLNATGGFDADGTATGNVAGGLWEAQSFGETDMRPEGFFGRFNANFTNGSVIGAYATDKK